jgi:hypothetical protein
MKLGRPSKVNRDKVRAALAAGKSQSEIARSLGCSQPYIAKLAREFGVTPAVYGEIVERVDGKRRCSKCGKWKTRGAFPTMKHSVCRVCYKPHQ